MATPAQGIARLGFRTWYERQLIESHIYFVTGFMSAVLIMALLEDLNLRNTAPMSLLSLVVIIAATLVGGGAIRRYMHLLFRAEALAEQCVCADCSSYGVIRVLDAGVIDAEENPQWMRVACKKCGHQWRLESS